MFPWLSHLSPHFCKIGVGELYECQEQPLLNAKWQQFILMTCNVFGTCTLSNCPQTASLCGSLFWSNTKVLIRTNFLLKPRDYHLSNRWANAEKEPVMTWPLSNTYTCLFGHKYGICGVAAKWVCMIKGGSCTPVSASLTNSCHNFGKFYKMPLLISHRNKTMSFSAWLLPIFPSLHMWKCTHICIYTHMSIYIHIHAYHI